MVVSPSDQIREVLQPSLLPVPDHSVIAADSPGDHHCVSDGVRDGTGSAVIKKVTTLIITSLHLEGSQESIHLTDKEQVGAVLCGMA